MIRIDRTACPQHQYSYLTEFCYDCVNAELAWIGQTSLALVERGYTEEEADTLVRWWAWYRRRGYALPEHIRTAQNRLKQPVYRH